MDYRTPLAKVRGLGTAHNGVEHWWWQRVSAIILIPLSFWLIVYIKHLLIDTHAQMLAWLVTPFNSFCAIVWLMAVFYHAAVGLQVVIEDYVTKRWQKILWIWLVKLSALGLSLASILTMLRLANG